MEGGKRDPGGLPKVFASGAGRYPREQPHNCLNPDAIHEELGERLAAGVEGWGDHLAVGSKERL